MNLAAERGEYVGDRVRYQVGFVELDVMGALRRDDQSAGGRQGRHRRLLLAVLRFERVRIADCAAADFIWLSAAGGTSLSRNGPVAFTAGTDWPVRELRGSLRPSRRQTQGIVRTGVHQHHACDIGAVGVRV